MDITVVGLGNAKGDLTLNGLNAIKRAGRVILRTGKTQAAKALTDNGIDYITLDSLYDEYGDFDALNEALAEKIAEYAADVPVAYCVDGNGLDDLSVSLLCAKHCVTVVAGVSRESGALSAVKLGGGRIMGVSALDFVGDRSFFAPSGTLVIKEIDNKYIASDVKLKLMELYGNESVYFVVNNKPIMMSVSDIDRQKTYNYSAAAVIPDRAYAEKSRFSFADLMAIVYRLRAKDGCKWDREQTHQSIRINCIEEAYELVEAIDLDDTDKMLEETGDVLLQGIFHAIIAEDTAEYTITDVLTVLCRKLLDRHTHIFGSVVANTPEEALQAWEAAKAKEKKQGNYTERMAQVAKNLPALVKAEKIQRIAAKANFDWQNYEGAKEKVFEEVTELENASNDNKEEEGGYLLFSAVNLLRHFGVEPETALYRAISKFQKRFANVEEIVSAKGKKMTECSLEELDSIYSEIKHADR